MNVSSAKAFNLVMSKILLFGKAKGACFRLSHRPCAVDCALHSPDLGTKFTKILRKSSLYSQSLLIFIQKPPVVESHVTREIKDLLGPRLTPTGDTVYFYMQSHSFTYWKYKDEASNIASDEEIVENNYMFVILWNLSVISFWIFPQCFFFISGAK